MRHGPHPRLYGHFDMSAQAVDSQFTFRLPSMSYIDAKWEEPNLRAPVSAPTVACNGGLLGWLAGFIAFPAWGRDHAATAELFSMSDRELRDIGLDRMDLRRVFAPTVSEDLRRRDACVMC